MPISESGAKIPIPAASVEELVSDPEVTPPIFGTDSDCVPGKFHEAEPWGRSRSPSPVE